MGVVFDHAHAMKTILLNCRTVFVACGLTKSRVLFLHHPLNTDQGKLNTRL